MLDIIAEIGSNFNSLQDCSNSISIAKNCGATTVKFQAFSHSALYGFSDEASPLNKYSLPLEWISGLKEKAEIVGIDLLITAFDVKTLEYINPFMAKHKIASSDATYIELVDAAIGTGKEVYLSLGACSMGDIEQIIGRIKNKDQFVFLYCNAAYPSRYHDLRVIDFLRSHFNVRVGYSDHSADVIYTPYMAVKFHGAIVLEKHVNFVNAISPDSPHSLSTDEFQRMVKAIRSDSMDILMPTPEELPMITMHKRRLVAIKDIAVGERFVLGENFGSYRVKEKDYRGISALKSQILDGKQAKADIKAHTPIYPEHV